MSSFIVAASDKPASYSRPPNPTAHAFVPMPHHGFMMPPHLQGLYPYPNAAMCAPQLQFPMFGLQPMPFSHPPPYAGGMPMGFEPTPMAMALSATTHIPSPKGPCPIAPPCVAGNVASAGSLVSVGQPTSRRRAVVNNPSQVKAVAAEIASPVAVASAPPAASATTPNTIIMGPLTRSRRNRARAAAKAQLRAAASSLPMDEASDIEDTEGPEVDTLVEKSVPHPVDESFSVATSASPANTNSSAGASTESATSVRSGSEVSTPSMKPFPCAIDEVAPHVLSERLPSPVLRRGPNPTDSAAVAPTDSFTSSVHSGADDLARYSVATNAPTPSLLPCDFGGADSVHSSFLVQHAHQRVASYRDDCSVLTAAGDSCVMHATEPAEEHLSYCTFAHHATFAPHTAIPIHGIVGDGEEGSGSDSAEARALYKAARAAEKNRLRRLRQRTRKHTVKLQDGIEQCDTTVASEPQCQLTNKGTCLNAKDDEDDSADLLRAIHEQIAADLIGDADEEDYFENRRQPAPQVEAEASSRHFQQQHVRTAPIKAQPLPPPPRGVILHSGQMLKTIPRPTLYPCSVEGPASLRTVHIRFIPPYMGQGQLRSELLQPFGPVLRVRVCANVNQAEPQDLVAKFAYAFVECATPRQAASMISILSSVVVTPTHIEDAELLDASQSHPGLAREAPIPYTIYAKSICGGGAAGLYPPYPSSGYCGTLASTPAIRMQMRLKATLSEQTIMDVTPSDCTLLGGSDQIAAQPEYQSAFGLGCLSDVTIAAAVLQHRFYKRISFEKRAVHVLSQDEL
eukprot:GILJ01011860.1.p1 GENE.GILJ01011860.1~~GILJ01011860.1.p1  ORF type:complete len:796 (+),score=108.34 GILJ01011860.1:388-2775(+)